LAFDATQLGGTAYLAPVGWLVENRLHNWVKNND